MMKLPILCIAVASAVISTTYLIIAEIPVHQSTPKPPPVNKTDLNTVSIVYDTTVSHMNKITLQEANSIKSNVKLAITEKLNTLNCQEGVDYTIAGLNLIVENQDLNVVTGNVIVNSISTSTKLTGSSDVLINVKEDITDRKIIPPIGVPQSEENGLSEMSSEWIKTDIERAVINIVNVSQDNNIGIDYTIDNIDQIKEGATFNSFKDIVFTSSIPTSATLTGSFKVDFFLDPDQ